MFFQWMNEKIKRMTVCDIGILKMCVAAFVLMVAKLWPPLLSLDWTAYGIIFLVTYIYLICKIYFKN